VITDITLLGFDLAGKQVMFSELSDDIAFSPTVAAHVTVEAFPADRASPDIERWSWRSNVVLRDVELRELCFASPRAPNAADCRPLDPVEIVPTP
jgi:hypothetical protein